MQLTKKADIYMGGRATGFGALGSVEERVCRTLRGRDWIIYQECSVWGK